MNIDSHTSWQLKVCVYQYAVGSRRLRSDDFSVSHDQFAVERQPRPLPILRNETHR